MIPEHPTLAKRRREDKNQDVESAGWYHSIELPGGRVIPGFHSLDSLRERFAEFPLPPSLNGKRVLDIGSWDGWFAFEAERRGAEVVALDNVEQRNFRYAHRELGSKARYEIAEVYEIPARKLGRFDYTLFLGVLYHLRHPLLALDIVCEATKEIAIVDSFVVDGDDEPLNAAPVPWMEFYETTELGNQIDNWTGPTVACLLALCRSAGFARVELLSIQHRHARVACYRRWGTPPSSPSIEPPVLATVVNAALGNYGINFYTAKEEFLTCWFSAEANGLRREDLRPEVSGLGVTAVSLTHDGGNDWHASFRLPPGLDPGWHQVRLRTADSGFSNPLPIAVDIPPVAERIEVRGVLDGLTWRDHEVSRSGKEPGCLALWISGLGEAADLNNVRVYYEDADEDLRLPVSYVSAAAEGLRQVNVVIEEALGYGERQIIVRFGTAVSEPVKFVISPLYN